MLTEVERRILHGLYVDNPRLDRWMSYGAAQINWLGEHDYADAARWRDGDRRCDLDIPGMDSVEESLLQDGMTHAALGHLQGARLLEYVQRESFDVFDVKITYAGAVVARRSHTWWRRRGIWYTEHKDGALGLLVTIVISAVTTLLTLWIKRALS